MKVEIVSVSDIDQIWPIVAPQFSKAAERCGDDFSSGEMWQMCRSGQAFLVVASDDEYAIKAALVARFERWLEGPVLRIVALGGADFRTWITDGMDFLKSFMAAGNADRIVFEGRDGWQRMPGVNVRKLRSTYVMEI